MCTAWNFTELCLRVAIIDTRCREMIVQETTEKLMKYLQKANSYSMNFVFPAVCSAENSTGTVSSPGQSNNIDDTPRKLPSSPHIRSQTELSRSSVLHMVPLCLVLLTALLLGCPMNSYIFHERLNFKTKRTRLFLRISLIFLE